MHFTTFIIPTICLSALGLPSAVVAKPKPTPIVFFPKAVSNVSERIAGLCFDRNSTVIEQTPTHVLCSRSIDGLQSAVAQVLIGNSYSTPLVLKFRFAIVRSEQYTRVQASQWIETQMAFGQIRAVPLDGRKHVENILGLLEGIGSSRTTPIRPTGKQ